MTTRRSALRGVGLAAGGALLGAGAATTATAVTGQGRNDKGTSATYVLVHGSNSSSVFWAPYVRELQLRGHRAIAIDQPYHGAKAHIPQAYLRQDLDALATEPTPMGEVTLDDYAQHVERTVRRAARDGPVVLVGHSMGGLSVSRVGDAVPELLSHICYMASFCCSAALPTMFDCMAAPEAKSGIVPTEVAFGDPRELGVSRYNFLTSDKKHTRMVREMIWGGYSDAAFRASVLQMQPDESYKAPQARAAGKRDRWGSIPRTYIRLGKDRLIPPQLQDRMIAEADESAPDTKFQVHNFRAPHYGPEDAADVADVLAGLAGA